MPTEQPQVEPEEVLPQRGQIIKRIKAQTSLMERSLHSCHRQCLHSCHRKWRNINVVKLLAFMPSQIRS